MGLPSNFLTDLLRLLIIGTGRMSSVLLQEFLPLLLSDSFLISPAEVYVELGFPFLDLLLFLELLSHLLILSELVLLLKQANVLVRGFVVANVYLVNWSLLTV